MPPNTASKTRRPYIRAMQTKPFQQAIAKRTVYWNNRQYLPRLASPAPHQTNHLSDRFDWTRCTGPSGRTLHCRTPYAPTIVCTLHNRTTTPPMMAVVLLIELLLRMALPKRTMTIMQPTTAIHRRIQTKMKTTAIIATLVMTKKHRFRGGFAPQITDCALRPPPAAKGFVGW